MKNNKGMTITEVMVVMGLLLTLFGFLTVNIVGTIRRPEATGAKDILLADIRAQQLKSMELGVSQSIALSTTSYTLSPDNFVINLPSGFSFSDETDNQNIIFDSETGEITPTTIVIDDTQIENDETIILNKYAATQ